MRVKKSDLRPKSAPQLPINYPGPEPIEFDFEVEKKKVENLCKRLADNEVEVRDAVLDELPAYLKEICSQYDARPLDLKADKVVSPYIGKDGEKKKLTRRERLERAIEIQKKNFSGLDDDELSLLFSKLALGIFFCYWHSDKPLVQHECAAKIARLLHYPTTADHKVTFLMAVLRVFSKKWTTIDQWRIDKYMSLARKLIFEFLRFIQHLRSNQEGTKVVQTRLVKIGEQGIADEAPTKRRGKRNRDDVTEEKQEDSASTAMRRVDETVFDLTLQRCIKVFQDEVVNGTARGLTMHVADIFLAEMLHAKITNVPLFVELAKGIPIYIMQRGNNTEKRVIDHFFVPIAAGQLSKLDPEEDEDETAATVDAKVSVQIARQLKDICKECSTSRGTSYSIRPKFSECELFLKHFLDQQVAPEKFEPENEKDRRVRLLREIRSASKSRNSREGVVQRKLAKKGAAIRKAKAGGQMKTKGTTRRKKIR